MELLKQPKRKEFPNYISRNEALEGVKTGKLLKGVLHINQKFTKHSFVKSEDPSQPDHMITTFFNRNRALDRDEVVVKIKNNKEIEVVHIFKQIHPRIAVGFLKIQQNESNFALFSPRDKTVPKMEIHHSSWPQNFETKPQHFKDVLFVVQITSWTTKRVRGKLIEMLGVAGNLKAETLAILREYTLTPRSLVKEFSFLNLEIVPREDLRRRCVFTIDNEATQDIDDALSCAELPNGNYEIGVHISDVGHFMKKGDNVDVAAMTAATNVYLVNTRCNMLPEDLRLVCSLHPGVDKFAFSIFFEITPSGEIRNRRGAKTVINSCCRLSYKDAQMLSESSAGVLPVIYHGFGVEDLRRAVTTLHSFAGLLRRNRNERYGVTSRRPSPSFRLDSMGVPTELVFEKTLPSQHLVEEFMVLANVTVAQRIFNDFPSLALLRVHESPNLVKINRLQEKLAALGVHINFSSAKKIQRSLENYSSDNHMGRVFEVVLNRIISKSMQQQKYVCTGGTITDFAHFGLGLPLYTHFTSPIRRYADIMTHRLLAGSLKYCPFNWTTEEVEEVAKTCNRQNFQAKKAFEASFDLHLTHYVDRHQPFVADAAVYNVKEESFDVVVFSTGSSLRIYTNTFDENWIWESKKICDIKGMWRIRIEFPQAKKTLIIDIFTVVKIELAKAPKLNRLKARLCSP